MKRRDFIKVSSAAGIAGLVGPGYANMAHSAPSKTDGFDLHPFIKEHPEAVFINLTSVNEKTDSKPIYDAAYKLASEMFVKTSDGEGYSNSTHVNCKPNWTCGGRPGPDPVSKLGITTDLNYIEGFLNGVKNTGPQSFSLRECACPWF
ncbi:MAG: twin-arginine translocation signal domain-containing protein, partial [Bacteroidota bacterium]